MLFSLYVEAYQDAPDIPVWTYKDHLSDALPLLGDKSTRLSEGIVLIISHDVVGSDRSSFLCDAPTVALNRYSIINATHGNSGLLTLQTSTKSKLARIVDT